MILLTITFTPAGGKFTEEEFQFDDSAYRVDDNNFLNVVSDALSKRFGGVDNFRLHHARRKEYEPFGDEWVKEVCKSPKEFIVKNLLRPALMKEERADQCVGNYTHPFVDIPITDDITLDGLQAYAANFGCYASKLNDTHYRISSRDACNLFWAGMNWNCTSDSPLSTTAADQYLRRKK